MNKKAVVTWVVVCMIVWVLGLILEENFSRNAFTAILVDINIISFLTLIPVSIIRLFVKMKISVKGLDPNRIVLSNLNLFTGPVLGTFAATIASVFCEEAIILGANLTISLAIGGSVGLILGVVFSALFCKKFKRMEEGISKADQKAG